LYGRLSISTVTFHTTLGESETDERPASVGLAKGSIVARSTLGILVDWSGDDPPQEKDDSEQAVLEIGYATDEDISVTR
jgi:hypothetical protein